MFKVENEKLMFNGEEVKTIKNSNNKTIKGTSAQGLWVLAVINGKEKRIYKSQVQKDVGVHTGHDIFINL